MIRLLKDKRAIIFGGYIILLVLGTLLGPLIMTHDPLVMSAGNQFRSPDTEHIFGTDEYGRDVFSRILLGARITLAVSFCATSIAAVLGVLLGLLAGYYGNLTETILMRGVDVILCFPTIVMAVFIVTFFGSSLLNIIVVISILYTPRFARIAYGVTLSLKKKEFVEAALAQGAASWRVLLKHILPNIFAPIIVQISLAFGHIILIESSISFLGLGPPLDIPSWGRMIQRSSRFMNISPHGVIWPSLAIAFTILAFNILGDALRDKLDPRLR